MPAPVSSWNLVRVYGTWRGMDGALKAGTYKVTLPARITNTTDDAIIPAGTYATGPLQTSVDSSPSLDIMVPATDDPDNAETGWKVTVAVTFPDAAGESYVLDVPYQSTGVNLRTVVLSASIPQQVALYKVGVPGGLAQLDSSGQVVDANGDPVTGGTGAVSSVAGRTGDVTLSKADVGLESVDNTADASKPVSTAQAAAIAAKYTKPGTGVPSTDLATAVQTSLGKADTAVQPAGLTKAAVGLGNVPNLDTSNASNITTGTLPTSVLPPLAINETFTAANQAAMLALTAQRGDMAIRTDNGKTFVLSTDSPATLADWKEVLAAGQVQSVAGKTGVVALVVADVSGLQAALDAKGTSNLALGTTSTTAKAGNYAPTLADIPAGSILAAPLDGSVNTTAGTARPSSRADIFFRWRSTVQPTNMLTGDEWLVAP